MRKTFSIKMDLENAAFQNGQQAQAISNILKEISNQIIYGKDGGNIRDLNGNKIGHWDIYMDLFAVNSTKRSNHETGN